MRHGSLASKLDLLPYAIDSPFNSNTKQHEPICLANTRVRLLQDVYDWANRKDQQFIFWLNGFAGTGKSTIARTVARHFFDEKRLGASFFFSKGGGDISHAGKFFTTIAKQLASSVPTLNGHVCEAIKAHADISTLSFHDQWHQLVLDPLSKMNKSSPSSIYILVIDALDECDNEESIRIILHLLAQARSITNITLRVFLTSRPEIPIRYTFGQIPNTDHQDFVLHNISPSIVDQDISTYFQNYFGIIRQERILDSSWPGEETIQSLVQRASGLFIWAATTCRFVREGKRFAANRLDRILRGSSSTPTAPERHLDNIYTTVLENSISPEFLDEEREELCLTLRQILGSIIILNSPLSITSLSKLLNVTKENMEQTLDDLHSVLDIPVHQAQPVQLHHPSFRDFLLNKNRCQDHNFWVDEKQAHGALADSCINLMSTSLKQDICEVNAPGMLVVDIDRNRLQRSLPPEVQYACLYWIKHLEKSNARVHENDKVHIFIQEHILHWLEALSWLGKISEGIYAISSLETIVNVSTSTAAQIVSLYSIRHIISHFFLNSSMTRNESSFITVQRSSKLHFKHIPVHLCFYPLRVLLGSSSSIVCLNGYDDYRR
jgi:hypothetical protein